MKAEFAAHIVPIPEVDSTSRGKVVARPKETFFGVQALRGLAAALVVVHHGTELWSDRIQHAGVTFAWGNGASGVDVFFVISGFVMATVVASGRITALSFLSRRLLRIAPMYWIATILAIAAIVFDHGKSGDYATRLHPWHLIASFLFIPSRDANGGIYPVLPVGWTLCYEMFFYLLFSIALAFKANLVRFLTIAMLSISILGVFYRSGWPAIAILTQPIILEFLAGVYLAYFVRKKRSISSPRLVFLGAAGLIGILLLPQFDERLRFISWGLPALALVSSVVLLESTLAPKIPRWILRIGDASYSLYLLHFFVVTVMVSVLRHLNLARAYESIFCLLALIASIFVALVAFHFVEAPITFALARRTHLRPPTIIVQGDHIETAS